MSLFTWLIVRPMGFLIELVYRVIPNYGVAIIVFTVVIKLLLLPLGLKSQRSMAKQQKLAPQLQELQQKYAADKEKLNAEMMKLYKANGVSLTGGCLPMLLQLPIIFGLYQVIQKPLAFVLRIDFLQEANRLLAEQLQLAVKLSSQALNIPKGFLDAPLDQLIDRFQIAMGNLAGQLGGEFAHWKINYNFLGMDLSRYPNEALGPLSQLLSGVISPQLLDVLPLLLIPLLAAATSWVLTKLTPQPQTPQPSGDAASPTANMGKSMTLMMPIMSLVFTFPLPSGIGLYWIVSNLVQLAQQYFASEHFKKKEDDTIVVDTVKKSGKNRKNHR